MYTGIYLYPCITTIVVTVLTAAEPIPRLINQLNFFQNFKVMYHTTLVASAMPSHSQGILVILNGMDYGLWIMGPRPGMFIELNFLRLETCTARGP